MCHISRTNSYQPDTSYWNYANHNDSNNTTQNQDTNLFENTETTNNNTQNNTETDTTINNTENTTNNNTQNNTENTQNNTENNLTENNTTVNNNTQNNTENTQNNLTENNLTENNTTNNNTQYNLTENTENNTTNNQYNLTENNTTLNETTNNVTNNNTQNNLTENTTVINQNIINNYNFEFDFGDLISINQPADEIVAEPVGENELARAWGDPHIEGANGDKYGFQEAGTYNMLKDKDININATTEKWPTDPDVTVITQVGEQFGSDSVKIDKTGQLTLNGTVLTLADGQEKALADGTIIKRVGDSYVTVGNEYDTTTEWKKSGDIPYLNLDIRSKAKGVLADNVAPTGILGETFLDNEKAGLDHDLASYVRNNLFDAASTAGTTGTTATDNTGTTAAGNTGTTAAGDTSDTDNWIQQLIDILLGNSSSTSTAGTTGTAATGNTGTAATGNTGTTAAGNAGTTTSSWDNMFQSFINMLMQLFNQFSIA